MEKRDLNRIDPEDYGIELKLRIDWSEMDLFGHVNNVMYIKYMQAARVNLWEKIGMKDIDENGLGPMLASTECQFIRPMFYPGSVRVHSRDTFLKNTSFGVEHVMIDDEDKITAIGADVIVYYNFRQNEKVLLNERLRSQLESYC